jgi:hypothetical protein
MIIRYDFGKTLDVSKFKVQAEHYISQINPLTYYLEIGNYELVVDVARIEDHSNHMAALEIFSLSKDADGEVLFKNKLNPNSDTLFKEFKIIQEIFDNPNIKTGHFTSSSNKVSVEKIINLINILFKIEKLKVFL